MGKSQEVERVASLPSEPDQARLLPVKAQSVAFQPAVQFLFVLDVPGIYRPRHPERSVLYRVLFHHFERFVAEYEERFEKAYGYFRPIIKDVVEKYLDCGNPRSGFARIRCPERHAEHLLTFSCKTRGFCPSCHAKRLEEWGEWVRETFLLDIPYRQVVFTIPKMLRVFFKFKRKLLGELCRSSASLLFSGRGGENT
jgi:hypothetical protein